jgi:hypothetical protein
LASLHEPAVALLERILGREIFLEKHDLVGTECPAYVLKTPVAPPASGGERREPMYIVGEQTEVDF